MRPTGLKGRNGEVKRGKLRLKPYSLLGRDSLQGMVSKLEMVNADVDVSRFNLTAGGESVLV
ncbi:MAG: hypothetical protein ACTS6A_02565 [Candidatus Hodgkinia cicadicola]